ncbi:hypothetical protein AB0N21_40415 [Streptomyces sp. NPDC051080]|uniref:hypothetical protein n=1 Tax=Streptomyces sp. NPDC051080 TaxID=3157222 RepID=UPI003415E9F6
MTSSKEHRQNLNSNAVPGHSGEEEDPHMMSEGFPSIRLPVNDADIPAEELTAETVDEEDVIADFFSEESFTEFLGQYDTLLSSGEVPSYTASELAARADHLFKRMETAAEHGQSHRPASQHDTRNRAHAPLQACSATEPEHWASARDLLAALSAVFNSALSVARTPAAACSDRLGHFDADLRLNTVCPTRPLRLSFLVSGMLLSGTDLSEHCLRTSADLAPVPALEGVEGLWWFMPVSGAHTAADAETGTLRLWSAGQSVDSHHLLPAPRQGAPRVLADPACRAAARPWLQPYQVMLLGRLWRKFGYEPASGRLAPGAPVKLTQQSPSRYRAPAVSSPEPHLLMVVLPSPASGQQRVLQWEAELALRWHERRSGSRPPDVVAAVLLLSSAHPADLQPPEGRSCSGEAEQTAALMIPVPENLRTQQELSEIQRFVNEAFRECAGKET